MAGIPAVRVGPNDITALDVRDMDLLGVRGYNEVIDNYTSETRPGLTVATVGLNLSGFKIYR